MLSYSNQSLRVKPACLSGIFVTLVFLFVMALPGQGMAQGTRVPFLDHFFKITTANPPMDANELFFMTHEQETPVQITQHRGKWIILNVWATWCAPCIAELPKLAALNRTAGADSHYTVLAVSVDKNYTADRIASTLKRWRVNGLTPLHDTAGVLAAKVDTGMLPVTYIVDPNGKIRAGLYGRADWSARDARDFVATLPKYGLTPGYFTKN